MKKTYLVQVYQTIAGEMFIEAETADEAKTLAQRLIDNGSQEVQPNPYNDDETKILDITEANTDEAEDGQENLKDNMDALAEIEE